MSTRNGRLGEQAAERVFAYEGWTITDRQYEILGHRVDFLAVAPDGTETLVEVKVWEGAASGRDTVLKAIAHAYDLRTAGENRPYLLVLSHDLRGLYHEMLRRAVDAGAISEVRVLTLVPVDFGTTRP